MNSLRQSDVIWPIYLAPLLLIYLTVPVSPDQALFDYIAWSHIHGDAYYLGVAEQNWPGKMFMHELGIRLFGANFWTFRSIDFVTLVLIALSGAYLLSKAGLSVAARIFLYLYPVLYITAGEWMAGQRDIVAGGLLLVAAALSLKPQSRFQVVAAGVTVAIVVLMRPTYLSYLVGLLALLWIRFPNEPRRSARLRLRTSLTLLIGFAGPIFVVFFVGFISGALPDFFEQAIAFNIEVYQDAASRSRLQWVLADLLIKSWHWITLCAALGSVAWLIGRRSTRALILVLGIAATAILSFYVQNKGFVYHLGGLLPVLTILVAAFLDLLVSARNGTSGFRRSVMSVMLFGFVALCAAGSAKKIASFAPNAFSIVTTGLSPIYTSPSQANWEDRKGIVHAIREGSTPDDFVLQWGRNFDIPYLAERRSSLRFVSTPALDTMGPSFSGHESWLEKVELSLRTKPPAFAVLDSAILAGNEVVAPPNASDAQRIMFRALADYDIVLRTNHIVLLQAPQ